LPSDNNLAVARAINRFVCVQRAGSPILMTGSLTCNESVRLHETSCILHLNFGARKNHKTIKTKKTKKKTKKKHPAGRRPLLVMLIRMTSDIRSFLALFIVFAIAYGVAVAALLHVNS
jgi:hypothetical protein